MKTTEGNKLIAEFMNATKPLLEHASNISGYDYHSSWDWLMPVVEKVTDQHDQNTYFYAGHIFDKIKDELYSANINGTWSAVVEFIEWYNNQNK